MNKLADDILILSYICVDEIERCICKKAWYELLEFGHIRNIYLARVLYLSKKYNFKQYVTK